MAKTINKSGPKPVPDAVRKNVLIPQCRLPEFWEFVKRIQHEEKVKKLRYGKENI
jgi:hypothetical protein